MTPLNPKTTDITEAAVENDPAVRRALWQELVAAQQTDDQRLALDHIAEEQRYDDEHPTASAFPVQTLDEAQGWLSAVVWLGKVRPEVFRMPPAWKARLSRLRSGGALGRLRPVVFSAKARAGNGNGRKRGGR